MSNLANLKNNFLKNFYIGDTAIIIIISFCHPELNSGSRVNQHEHIYSINSIKKFIRSTPGFRITCRPVPGIADGNTGMTNRKRPKILKLVKQSIKCYNYNKI